MSAETPQPSPTPDEIAERLRVARGLPDATASGQDDQAAQVNRKGLGVGFRISIELVVTILVGGAIGWFLDDWLGTKPVLMVVFLFLGGAAGVMNVYRVVKGLDDAVGLGRAVEQGNEESGKDENSGRSD
ncbi:MAG: AtpZ/AtpI family protein [Rhodospirillaceae bacterium]